jgi:hypothetical protein
MESSVVTIRLNARRTIRAVGKPLLALAACALSIAGNAQVVPGYRAPNDLVDAAAMAVTGGCRLASANRPLPGINMPAGSLAGEGITEYKSAPDWVEKASASQGAARYSTLASPEGPVWIRFDESTARCSVIVRPSDVAQFRAAFAKSLAKGATDMQQQTNADGSETFLTQAKTFAWVSRVSSPAVAPDVVLIETTFSQK